MQYIFIIKNPILINFFTVKVSGYDVITIGMNFSCFFFCTKNSPNDIISGTLTVKKLIKMRFFTINRAANKYLT